MKKSRNFIISSLVALTGATLASSVTGTVAWFQYATSASVAITGTTVGCSKLLQISDDDGAHWYTDLAYGQGAGSEIEFTPVTSGDMGKNGALPTSLSKGPTYRKADQDDWGLAAAVTEYQQYSFRVRLNDVSNGNPGTPEAADICLSDLTIVNANANTDLEEAIRVHVAVKNYSKYLFSLNGGSTAVCGQLDLNNDGQLDKSGYAFEEQEVINYNGTGKAQVSYAADDNSIIGAVLGNTGADYLEITVTIWVEGWALLDTGVTGNAQTSNTAVWNNTTYNSNDFHVGMTFDVVE